MPRYSGMRLALDFRAPPDLTPPRFLTTNSGANNEGSPLAFTITTDEQCTIAITGGVDAAQFELATTSLAFSHVLRWVGNGAQHYASPADSDANNVYLVQVTATDQSGSNTTSQSISITVSPVSAGGVFGLLAGITKAA